jgi:hypothetical protein
LHQEHFYFSLIRVWVNAHNLITARVCEDPEAEVIALSPRTLVATNRFVCEICNKGFQRDQNLQLHRRGHNLPWKLRQRTPSAGGRQGDAAAQPPRKRVYVCPEPTCIHHDPTRYSS